MHHCVLLPTASWRIYHILNQTETLQTHYCPVEVQHPPMVQGDSPGPIGRACNTTYRRQRNHLHRKYKKCNKGAVVRNNTVGGTLCPVTALARQLHNIRQGSSTCPISTVFHLEKQPTRVSNRDIPTAVWWGATVNGLLDRGYSKHRVSSHSLQSGGAMALILAGESLESIMIVGQWTSLTYMTYIHARIGALAKGLAWRISKQHTFHNVG